MLELASIPLTMGPVLLLAIVHFSIRKTLGASIPLILGLVFSQSEGLEIPKPVANSLKTLLIGQGILTQTHRAWCSVSRKESQNPSETKRRWVRA